MKQRKHKPTPERKTFELVAEALARSSNHSPKRLQRLRASLAHFELVRRGIRAREGTRKRARIGGLLRLGQVAAAVLASGPVMAVPSSLSEEVQALVHLANYRRMVAAGASL